MCVFYSRHSQIQLSSACNGFGRTPRRPRNGRTTISFEERSRGVVKKKLSKEEARVAAEKLRLEVAEKKKKEEAELEKVREKERIRSGKELLEAKRKEEALQLKRNAELRRIEKDEEERARQKIRLKLEEDKKRDEGNLDCPKN